MNVIVTSIDFQNKAEEAEKNDDGGKMISPNFLLHTTHNLSIQIMTVWSLLECLTIHKMTTSTVKDYEISRQLIVDLDAMHFHFPAA